MQIAIKLLSGLLLALMLFVGHPVAAEIAPVRSSVVDGGTVFEFQIAAAGQVCIAVLSVPIEVQVSRATETGTAQILVVAGDGPPPPNLNLYKFSRQYIPLSDGNASIDVTRFLQRSRDSAIWVAIAQASDAVFGEVTLAGEASLKVLLAPEASLRKPATYAQVNRETEGESEPGSTEHGSDRLDVSVQPNPFNPRVTIGFRALSPGDIRVEIFTVSGRRVWSKSLGSVPAGRHELVWEGADQRGIRLASGIYHVVIQGNTWQRSTKLTLVR